LVLARGRSSEKALEQGLRTSQRPFPCQTKVSKCPNKGTCGSCPESQEGAEEGGEGGSWHQGEEGN